MVRAYCVLGGAQLSTLLMGRQSKKTTMSQVALFLWPPPPFSWGHKVCLLDYTQALPYSVPLSICLLPPEDPRAAVSPPSTLIRKGL